MPSVKQNQRVNKRMLEGGGKHRRPHGKDPIGPDVHPWDGGELGPPDRDKFPFPAPPQQMGLPSQFFMSSLPGIAASYDQFQRQFYGRNTLPLMRIFVPNLK
jgi:hypothetical protein